MGLQEGYVAYVNKSRNAAITIKSPKRSWHGPNEVYDPGFTAEFRGHLFTTNDPELIKLMDAHPRYGVTFKRVETASDYDAIRRHGTEVVRMARGPATTLAEKMGAPRPVGPDETPISEIAPPPEDSPLRGKKKGR